MKGTQRDVDRLRPIDDPMFRVMALSKAFCEEVLRVLLEDKRLKVVKSTPQAAVTNLRGRSVVLDALCELSDGRLVNVEVQRSEYEDHQRRVRYYASLVTADRTPPGGRFRDVPDVCVVLVGEFDPFGAACSLYHVDRVVRETGRIAENGLCEVYVNALARDGSDVAALMEVFTEAEAYDETRFPATSREKRRLRHTEEGRGTMSRVVEEIRAESKAEGRLEGRLEGRAEGRAETLDKLVRDGLVDVRAAAASLGLDPEEVERMLA